jgi:ATP-binding cassette subfamily C protein
VAFARPHRRKPAWFLLLSVLGAVLAVATPVLAGPVVDAIVQGQDYGIGAGLSALIALAEAGRTRSDIAHGAAETADAAR